MVNEQKTEHAALLDKPAQEKMLYSKPTLLLLEDYDIKSNIGVGQDGGLGGTSAS